MDLMFQNFKNFKYFGVNVSAYTNKDNDVKKCIKSPVEKLYKNTKHYFKKIYDKEIDDYIEPNGISIITKDLSSIDVDDVEKCEILDKLLIDCSFIVKTRKGFHFYFKKENILKRQKQCDIADINLKTLFFIPKYYHNETNEEFNYTLYKNSGDLVDMPLYAIEWCNKLIKEKDEEKKDKKDKKELKRSESDEGISIDNNKQNEIIEQILGGLKPSRFSNYGDWFVIACVFVNENLDINLFDEYSKKGKGYNKESNEKIINSLRKKSNNGYKMATLYYMLKTDNFELWQKLQACRSDFWHLMDVFNHYDIALFYFQLYPKKYVYSCKNWYILTDKNIYKKLDDFKDTLFNNITTSIQNIITEQIQFINLSDEKFLYKNKIIKKNFNNIGNSTFKKGIIDALCGLYYVDNIENKLNENINLIAFEDKVFDITTGDYRDIKADDYISMTVGYNAPTEKEINKNKNDVKDLLWSIFEDKDVIEYWFKTIGLSMFGNRSESLFIHTGSGRNGKGVLCNILEKCFGSYYQQADSQLLTGETKSPTNPTLANARFTRLLVLSEPDDTDEKTYKLKTSLIKAITGGDTITVRDLHKTNISYKPKFNIILQCNKKPEIDKMDKAIEHRLKVIHYPFTFIDNPSKENEKQIDTTLKDKKINDETFIKSFMGVLLDYAFESYKDNVIELPFKVKEQNTLYFDENNPVKDFLIDYCEITNNEEDKIGARDLYIKYIESNTYKKIDEIKFSYMMCNLNKIIKKKISGKLNGRFYIGLKYKILNEIIEN